MNDRERAGRRRADGDPNAYAREGAPRIFAQRLAAEACGAFLLVAVDGGSAIVAAASHGDPTPIGRSAASGLLIMSLVYAMGDVSGAHFNPAVTFAFALRRVFPWSRIVAYWASQLAGAFFGRAVLALTFGHGLREATTAPRWGTASVFAVETLATYILVCVVLGTATRHRIVGPNAAVASGAAVAIGGIFARPVSGASMNPARSLAPAIASGSLAGAWIYVVAPLTGALLATATMGIVHLHRHRKSEKRPKESERSDRPRARAARDPRRPPPSRTRSHRTRGSGCGARARPRRYRSDRTMTIRDDELLGLHEYFSAANYLTVGQIYLLANPLLNEPLRVEHIKPRLLGHWGTSPGLSLVYVHLNRIIRERDVDLLFLAGPGHGGPAVLANVYLEGTYSNVYPEITTDAGGMLALFRQFSTPGGVPSHVGPPTPGSIHEGGELGYVLTHAFGAVFDNPDLVAVAVVGDGEAETGPLEGSWKGVRFLNPKRDGAVLPILHLNGYKISGPTVLGRAPDASVGELLSAHGYEPMFVEGDDPMPVHRALADTLDRAFDRIREIQRAARGGGGGRERMWPAIVLRTPKGWTGPKELDGVRIEGTFRAHQVPLAGVRSDARQLAMLEAWMKSYRPKALFDRDGTLRRDLAALAPPEARRMGASRYANGGAAPAPLVLPDYRRYAVSVPSPAVVRAESTRALGALLRDVYAENPRTFRFFCPDETNSNRLGAVFEVESRCFQEATLPDDDHVSPDGRVMEVLSEHNCEGWLEGYVLTGRHGLFATYEAFALIVASMATQHAKWLEACAALPWRVPVPSLNYLLTSTCWRNDHNGFSHQGPGFMDTILSKKGTVARVYLPPDANCLLSVADHCLRSSSYVNLIIIDKQPELQWLDMAAAEAHCARGASVWEWASFDGEDPDVVLACAGDTATLETVAAASWLREHVPDLQVRVVNVVDLMCLVVPAEHPHGMTDERFIELFTESTDVVFAFHGYAGAVHSILHGRPDAHRFHVRGYKEEGTTTTPFDMVVLNETSRFHLAIEALRRARRTPLDVEQHIDTCLAMLSRHRAYAREHFEDMPEIRDWTWPRG